MVNGVWQTEIHTAEALVPEPSVCEGEMSIEKLKRHKSPDIDPVPSELIKVGGRTIHSEIHKLINSIRNEEDLPEQWKELIIAPTCKMGVKQTVVIIQAYHFCQLHTKLYRTSHCQG